MRARMLSIAFLLSVTSVGAAWFSLQPMLAHFVDAAASGTAPPAAWLARARSALPVLLVLDVVASSLLTYLVLYLTVERPLRQTEGAIESIGKMGLDVPLEWTAGPLLSRVQRTLQRTAQALAREQAVTQQQVVALKEGSQRLASTQAGLAAAERLATAGRLATGVAHEVGNPLSGILGYLSLAKSRSKDAEVVDYLGHIEHEVQRIDQIVRGLLDLGRPSRGPPGPLQLAPVVENCVRLASASPDFSQVAIRLDVPADLNVRAAAGPLSQVLLNLLINAAEAMGGRGEVVVRSRQEGAEVAVEVLDSGPGIAAEHIPHLFEPFYTTKAGEQGTGLGLAISQHLVTGMGGRLVAANASTRGAVFTLTLPAV